MGYHWLVDEHEEENYEHGIEDSFVVGFLDPGIYLHKVEK